MESWSQEVVQGVSAEIEKSITYFYEGLYECLSSCEYKVEALRVSEYLEKQYPNGCSIDVIRTWNEIVEDKEGDWEEE